ncbi:hypothetical protein ACIA5D_20615 [Actinoplanes sp. NPDC051513]|uniref:hypothetical protein n=1 Tax=Actinoplanes sp. NPDC051513 TaxID=3363908 RepID=UPI00379DFF57
MEFFTKSQLAEMRDPTRSRRYSPAREEFRRVHARQRAWGLVERHARKLRRLHGGDDGSPLTAAERRLWSGRAGTPGRPVAPVGPTAPARTGQGLGSSAQRVVHPAGNQIAQPTPAAPATVGQVTQPTPTQQATPATGEQMTSTDQDHTPSDPRRRPTSAAVHTILSTMFRVILSQRQTPFNSLHRRWQTPIASAWDGRAKSAPTTGGDSRSPPHQRPAYRARHTARPTPHTALPQPPRCRSRRAALPPPGRSVHLAGS